MGENHEDILSLFNIGAYHKKWMEELDFILDSIRSISEEDREAVKVYMGRTFDYIDVDQGPEEAPYFRYSDLEEYEEKIKTTKQEIKYLKKLRKKKDELEEKKIKRYKILRKLYKEGQLDPNLEGEYSALRQEMKYRKNH